MDYYSEEDDFDDYGVDPAKATGANGASSKDAAVAKALRAVGEADKRKRQRPIPKIDFERYLGSLFS
jgi:hypothetical protein